MYLQTNGVDICNQDRESPASIRALSDTLSKLEDIAAVNGELDHVSITI